MSKSERIPAKTIHCLYDIANSHRKVNGRLPMGQTTIGATGKGSGQEGGQIFYLKKTTNKSQKLVGLCGPQQYKKYTEIKHWKVSKIYFDVFSLFSQLRACNVSVNASGGFFHVGKSIC